MFFLFQLCIPEKGYEPLKILDAALREIKSRYDIFELTIQIEEYQEEMQDCQQCQNWTTLQCSMFIVFIIIDFSIDLSIVFKLIMTEYSATFVLPTIWIKLSRQMSLAVSVGRTL